MNSEIELLSQKYALDKEIVKQYKLTNEEHENIFEKIKEIYFFNKKPVKNPVAIIVGGQTGAGKTGLISYSQNQFKDDNVVIINSDDIKAFHPYGAEIAKKYTELFTKITGQESDTWTSEIFEYAIENKYNLIFEVPMKNNRIVKTITKLRDNNFLVKVRGLAVSNTESMMSVYERYVQQVKIRGWGRLVVPNHHNETYIGMPNTIDEIEKSNNYDVIEIFTRGEVPNKPKCIYSTEIKNEYISAKAAIYAGREKDKEIFKKNYNERLQNLIKIDNKNGLNAQKNIMDILS